uniref:Uncharacterized protein n=1 Tax=Mycena chlorophos TaxID=658473 RepID=A0ABQ0LYF0_MYCCL|nr:predicted protein [Mycena chlorophos]
MAALARTVLTTTLLAFAAVRPLAVLTDTLMLISMFSCIFFAYAHACGVSLPSLLLVPWLAVDPKVVDIQFQAFATVCCAATCTLLLTAMVYFKFSVFPAKLL